MAFWLAFLTFVVFAQETKIWQLSSETQVSRFSPDAFAAVPYSSPCFEDAPDYTTVFWTWQQRFDDRKQLLLISDESQTHSQQLVVMKSPGTTISVFLFQGDEEVTFTSLFLAGAPPKTWELISVGVSQSANSITLCSATKETPATCVSETYLMLPRVSTTRTVVNLGARDLEMVDAKVYSRVLTEAEIQIIARRGVISSSLICQPERCFGFAYPDFSCYSMSRNAYEETVLPGRTGDYTFMPTTNFNSIRIDLEVTAGEADLYMFPAHSPDTIWASRLPGSDSLTVTRSDPAFLQNSLYKITVPCLSITVASYLMTQEILDSVPSTSHSVQLPQAVARAYSVNRASIAVPASSESAFLVITLFAALIGAIGLSFYCGANKRPLNAELREKLLPT